MNDVIAIAYITNRKLLVVKSIRSARQNMFTLVGGIVEDNENILDACVRESKEEINNELMVFQNSFEKLFDYIEPAASDTSLVIKIHVYLSKKSIDVELIPNLEIIEFRYIDSSEDKSILSSSVGKFLEYAKAKDMID